MEKAKKLDGFVIEDNLNLTPEELRERAQDIAAEQANIHNWASFKVLRVGSAPTRVGEFLRYEFEVIGVQGEGFGTATSSRSDAQILPKPKVAASPDAGA